MTRRREMARFLVIFGLLTCGLAALLPLTQDEAYYGTWAERLQWGYYDHPPWVAAAARLGRELFPSWPLQLQLRLGPLLCGWVSFALLLGRLAPAQRRAAAPLLLCCLYLVLSSVLVTPDCGLLLGWSGVLFFLPTALARGRYRDWIGVGCSAAVAVNAKLSGLILGPCIVVASWRLAPHQLTRLPIFVGGLCTLVLMMPNLKWNADHAWISWRFQLLHGLDAPRDQLGTFLVQPPPEQTPPAQELAPEPAPLPAPAKNWRALHFWEFVASQLASFGFGIVAIAAALGPRRRLRRWGEGAELEFSLIPWGLFALLSLRGKVEANWAAPASLAAATVLAQTRVIPLRRAWAGAAAGAAVLTLYAAHGRNPFLPLDPGTDRILRESYGIDTLGTQLEALAAGGPVFADTYQNVAMLRLMFPSLTVHQWPGITRNSQFLDPSWWLPDDASPWQAARLILASERSAPIPQPLGFRLSTAQELTNCDGAGPDCRVVRHWRLLTYLRHEAPPGPQP